MLGFDRAQLGHPPIVLGVRDHRIVEDVVTIVVIVDLPAQFAQAFLRVGHVRRLYVFCGLFPESTADSYVTPMALWVARLAPGTAPPPSRCCCLHPSIATMSTGWLRSDRRRPR